MSKIAIANGAAPTVSLTIRNLSSQLSRSIAPQGLDPHIPAFQIDENGFAEKHADNVAYESMDASGNIALQVYINNKACIIYMCMMLFFTKWSDICIF
jgi:hypothetical protein